MRNQAALAERVRWVPRATGMVLEIGAGTGYGAGKGALIGVGVGAAAGAIYHITKHEK